MLPFQKIILYLQQNNMVKENKSINLETAEILKESLRIAVELSKLSTVSGYNYTSEEIEDLIDRAEKLTKHRLFKL